VGQVIAFGMIVLGVTRFFGGAGFNGLWIAFIGWFLLNAARESHAQVALTDALRGVRVADVMSPDYVTVDGHSNLQTFVEEHLVRTGRRCFVVTFNGQAEGLITPNEIKAIQRARWPYTTIGDVTRPLNQLQAVAPNTPVSEALEVMAREDLNQLAVIREGKLAGVISRANVLQLLRTRAELQV
jgi:CBS domain-containing protein